MLFYKWWFYGMKNVSFKEIFLCTSLVSTRIDLETPNPMAAAKIAKHRNVFILRLKEITWRCVHNKKKLYQYFNNIAVFL